MKKLILLITIIFVVGCSRPLERRVAYDVTDNKLTVIYYAAENEKWYNKTTGRIAFNEIETLKIKELLKKVR